jgi:murein DD-endopeptidase MepM/ murein hydrolase activator NlpD
VTPLLLLVLAAGEDLRFDPPSPRQGDLLLIYLKSDGPDLGTVELLGYQGAIVRAKGSVYRGAVAVPMEAPIGPQPIQIRLGDRVIPASVDIAARDFDEEELTVGKKFTKKPDAALKARLKKEEEEMDAVWDALPSTSLAFGPVVRPVPGIITGNFGTARVFNGKKKSTHLGLDLNGQEGDPVRAAAGGKVVMSSMRFASGGTLLIDHGGGLFTAYFHLSRRDKKIGDKVDAGELLGAVGKTGRVTGPHLHLAVIVRSVYANGKRAGTARSMYTDPGAFLGLTLGGNEEAPLPADAMFGGGQ